MSRMMIRNNSRILKFIIFEILFLCFVLFSFAQAQQDFAYDDKGRRNPFIPLITSDGRLLKLDKEESIKGFLIEGIIYDRNGLSYAIINGEVIKTGDKIGDYQILKVERNAVILIKDGRPVELEFDKEEE